MCFFPSSFRLCSPTQVRPEWLSSQVLPLWLALWKGRSARFLDSYACDRFYCGSRRQTFSSDAYTPSHYSCTASFLSAAFVYSLHLPYEFWPHPFYHISCTRTTRMRNRLATSTLRTASRRRSRSRNWCASHRPPTTWHSSRAILTRGPQHYRSGPTCPCSDLFRHVHIPQLSDIYQHCFASAK